MDTVIHTGKAAPDFHLQDLQRKRYSLGELRGKIVILNFWSADCDWCARVDEELIATLDEWNDKVIVLWIASNANESVELIEKVSSARNLPNVVVDAQQQMADLYGAQTTPHFFIVDGEGKLAYQGAWDDRNFRQRITSKVYVKMVVDALLQGQPSPVEQIQPYGCILVRHTE